MCHVESSKKCDFVDIFEFFSMFWNLIHFWHRRFSLNFRKLLLKYIFIFCLVNWTYVPRWIEQKCDFLDIFGFSSTFRNSIHYWPRRFSLNFIKLLFKFIFIFCLVNWTYVPRWIEQKMWLCRYFWIFFYVSEHNSFLAS